MEHLPTTDNMLEANIKNYEQRSRCGKLKTICGLQLWKKWKAAVRTSEACENYRKAAPSSPRSLRGQKRT